jgi:acyl-CoA thioester hydrolase
VSEPIRNHVDIEVRYAETDAMGIVHHSNYVVWFELARTHLCRQTGKEYAAIERDGHSLTVTRTDVRYRRPAHYGETVRVEAWIERLASRKVEFGYEVHRGEELLTTGTTEHVWIDVRGRPCRMPADVAPEFERMTGGRP